MGCLMLIDIVAPHCPGWRPCLSNWFLHLLIGPCLCLLSLFVVVVARHHLHSA
jgi:hypothetical protein